MAFLGLWLTSVTCLALSSTAAIEYVEVNSTGPSCFPNDTCRQGRGKSRGFEDLMRLNCACDALCVEYGDCCVDALPLQDERRKRLYHHQQQRQWECVDLQQHSNIYHGVFVLRSCKPGWANSSFVTALCKHPMDPSTLRSPLMGLPVTNRNTGVTYRNVFCAVCNDDSVEVEVWDTYVQCLTIVELNRTLSNITTEFIRQNLIYSEERRSWGVMLVRQEGQPASFEECKVIPKIPDELKHKIRECKTNLTSECARDWPKDDDTRNKCAAYQGSVYRDQDGYRNVHCALCNRVNASDIRCTPMQGRDFGGRGFEPTSLSALLEFYKQPWDCPKYQVYDSYNKRCLNFVCGWESVQYRNGRCAWNGEDEADAFTPVTGEDDGNVPNPRSIEGLEPAKNLSRHVLPCRTVRLLPSDYNILPNGSAHLPKHGNQVLDAGDYIVGTDGLLVCDSVVVVRRPPRKSSVYLGYVTIVGLAISIVSLILHLTVFFLVPDMHNLAGKNLASLAVSLLCAYICFILGQLSFLTSVGCKIMAILIYYFFLAAFFWMNVMAFDVWRTLRMATRELRVSTGRQWGRFLGYSLYGWVTPALPVCSVVVIEYSAFVVREELMPNLGHGSMCWFGNKVATLVFFAAPAGLLMACNLGMFISSTCMIVSTKVCSMKQESQSSRRNFRLYIRLAIMMGLSWTVGFVAGYTELDMLWYAFVLLNTLQGLFIFVAFSFNEKVRTYLRGKVCKPVTTVGATQSTSFRSPSDNIHHSTRIGGIQVPSPKFDTFKSYQTHREKNGLHTGTRY